jgi:hypothetical protein
MDDTAAMDKIAGLMSGEEWNSDVMDEVAAVVRATGRPVLDFPPPEEDE